jgi:hypothetical protein
MACKILSLERRRRMAYATKTAGTVNRCPTAVVNSIFEWMRRKAWEVLPYVSILTMAILLVCVVYKFAILLAPLAVKVIESGKGVDVLSKLELQTAVVLILIMTGLTALVFWLGMEFGRRLLWRAYMAPLARDAIARAETASPEASPIEDLRFGKKRPELEPGNTAFKGRYHIPSEENTRNVIPGTAIDETGCILGPANGSGTVGLGGSDGLNRLPRGTRPEGTAFTDKEWEQLGLAGPLLDAADNRDQQFELALRLLEEKQTELERYLYLIRLCGRTQTLFYKILMSDRIRFLLASDSQRRLREIGYIWRRMYGTYTSIRHNKNVAEVPPNKPR